MAHYERSRAKRETRKVVFSEHSAPVRVELQEQFKRLASLEKLTWLILGALLGMLSTCGSAEYMFRRQIAHDEQLREITAQESLKERQDRRAADIRDQYAALATVRRRAAAFLDGRQTGSADDVLQVTRFFEEMISSVRSRRTSPEFIMFYFERAHLFFWSNRFDALHTDQSGRSSYFNPDDMIRFRHIADVLKALERAQRLRQSK